MSEVRGVRLSPDWVLGEIGLHYALTNGLTEADAQHEARKFKSYWLAAAGSNAVKRDWMQCWQVWVLNSLRKYGIKPASTGFPAEPALSPERRAELAARYSKK